MAKQAKYPVTNAIRFLRGVAVEFSPQLYDYVEKGGTAVASEQLGVDEHAVVKTIVFEDEQRKPCIVLMHGDCEVSAKTLARIRGVKTMTPCAPEVVSKHTGYQVGGTSPFGTKTKIDVVVEESILELPEIYINGGKRGFLVAISPKVITELLSPLLAHVSTAE